jgi:hypothetical protein
LLFACGVAKESSECLGYLARSSSAALITCAMIFLAELQACKRGDMAAFEVPWGHVSPLAIRWAIERDRFKHSKRSLFAIVEKH